MAGSHDAHPAEKRKAWNAGSKLVAEVLQEGGIARKMEGNKRAVGKTVVNEPNSLTCGDGRAAPGVKRMEGRRTCVGCAGCGILIKGVKEYLMQGVPPSPEIKAFVEELKKQNIRYVYPHKECGAADRFAQDVGEQEKGEFYSKLWASKLAALIKGEMRGIAPVEPKGFHDERALYVDLTPDGRFNPDEAPRVFPKGFHASVNYLDPEQAAYEVGVYLGIAFGNHGFGELFTEQNPFIVYVAAYSEAEAITKGRAFLSVLRRYGSRVVFKTIELPRPKQ